MVGAEVTVGGLHEAAKVAAGGGDLAGLSETAAGQVQHSVRIRLIQRVFCIGGEGGGVGPQSPRSEAVVRDPGPGSRQGVGCNAGNVIVLID